MSENESKHVQTELDAEEYEAFREFARERGLSVKEASHEAILEWAERQRRADPNDPAFTVLDDLETPGDAGESTTDARTAPDLVDEWDGDDVEFSLASDPEPER